jgi:putative nucleotidyltransferase with HDIG domain
MPGVDGTTLIARTRNDSPDTIRIVLSGYADERQSQRLVSLAHRYLSKPCEPKRLEECVDRCLATHALIQSTELRVRLGSVTALDLGQLQRHALSVAAVARSLATETAWAEDAFLSGLLHDVGFLLLGRQYKDEMQRALEATATGMLLADAEQKFVGIDHGTAGAYLLGLWGLPYEVVDTVAHHEDPARIRQTSFDVRSAVGIAHPLLAEIRPADVPLYEANNPMLGDEYVRALGFPQSWESLVERASMLLDTEQAA